MPSATIPAESALLVSPIRKASREVVREWGYLRPHVANTTLSSPAVHALVEIGGGATSRSALVPILRAPPAVADRAVAELVADGLVNHDPAASVPLLLTPAGLTTLAEIDEYGSGMVQRALECMPREQAEAVLGGLQAYVEALRGVSDVADAERPAVSSVNPGLDVKDDTVVVEKEVTAEGVTVQSDNQIQERSTEITIEEGYRPGILGRTLELHMEFYPGKFGLGWEFESQLAESMSSVLQRVHEGQAKVWAAVERDTIIPQEGKRREEVVGVVWLDEGGNATPGAARVRCFIVGGNTRGKGVGKRLMTAMMDYATGRTDLDMVELWTIDGLGAACKLYEQAGFVRVFEADTEMWNKVTRHIKYHWHRSA